MRVVQEVNVSCEGLLVNKDELFEVATWAIELLASCHLTVEAFLRLEPWLTALVHVFADLGLISSVCSSDISTWDLVVTSSYEIRLASVLLERHIHLLLLTRDAWRALVSHGYSLSFDNINFILVLDPSHILQVLLMFKFYTWWLLRVNWGSQFILSDRLHPERDWLLMVLSFWVKSLLCLYLTQFGHLVSELRIGNCARCDARRPCMLFLGSFVHTWRSTSTMSHFLRLWADLATVDLHLTNDVLVKLQLLISLEITLTRFICNLQGAQLYLLSFLLRLFWVLKMIWSSSVWVDCAL